MHNEFNTYSSETSLPGVGTYDPVLMAKFVSVLTQLGPLYHPRTHHLDQQGHAKFNNRLILESSPYLLQHASTRVESRC